MNYSTKFTLEVFLEIISDLIWQHQARELIESEKAILEGVWKKQEIIQIAKDKNYSDSHLDNVGSKLWRDLSEALGEKVNKPDVIFIIERKWRRGTQLNLSPDRTQFKDRFVDFLWVTRNNYAKHIGNIDSSCNLLVKDSANKLWQKPCGVGEKLTSENWQAACQPKFERDTKLTEEIAVQVIDSWIYLCTGKSLTYLEEKVVRGIWNHKGIWNPKNYDDIANKTKRSRCKNRELCGSNCQCKYSPNYLRRNIARDLWTKLSKPFFFLDYEIKKDNFKPTLERWHEKMKSSSTCSY